MTCEDERVIRPRVVVPTSRRWGCRRRRWLGGAVAVALAVPGVAVASGVGGPADPTLGAAPPPVLAVGGVRYVLGEPGDVALLGDWDCDGIRTPALYRPATGGVFEFDAWGDGVRSRPARPSGVLHGTATAAVDGSGCERVVVGRTDPFVGNGRNRASGGE